MQILILEIFVTLTIQWTKSTNKMFLHIKSYNNAVRNLQRKKHPTKFLNQSWIIIYMSTPCAVNISLKKTFFNIEKKNSFQQTKSKNNSS